MNNGYAEKYNLYKLVYIEETVSVEDAIRREKQLKKWSRNKKISLIESINPNWANLMSK